MSGYTIIDADTHVTEAPDRDENSITGLLELPDNRGEEVSVGRVIEVDPNAHF